MDNEWVQELLVFGIILQNLCFLERIQYQIKHGEGFFYEKLRVIVTFIIRDCFNCNEYLLFILNAEDILALDLNLLLLNLEPALF